MKLFYFLLLCNLCIFASEKPAPLTRTEMLRDASENRPIGLHGTGVKRRADTFSSISDAENLTANDSDAKKLTELQSKIDKIKCRNYCIGATAGVCFATTLCCGLIRCIENNKK